MNIFQVKQHIHTRNFSPVYIFTGEETGVMNIYVQQIGNASGKAVARMDTFLDVFNKVSKMSLMNKSHVYVVRDDEEVLKNEKAWEILRKADWEDIVILLFTSVDKRTKFYKQFEDRVCAFEPLGVEILTKYIQKEIPLSEVNCQRLAEICGNSYSRIMLEVDKMKSYQRGMNYTDDDKVCNHVFTELLEAGAIYRPPKDAIFDWSDAVMGRKKELAFTLMRECFDCGEAVMVMLSVLYNNVRQTLQVQTAKTREIGKETGLTGWQVQCGKKFLNKYKTTELLNALITIRNAERGVKTGMIEEGMAIPYVLVSIL